VCWSLNNAGSCSLQHAARRAWGQGASAEPGLFPWDTWCILTSPSRSCQAHHRAGVMDLLGGCCHADTGVILNSRALGQRGRGEGAARAEMPALHGCAAGDPSAGSSVPRGLAVVAGGEPSPGPGPPWLGRAGPQELHPCLRAPSSLIRSQVRAHACTRVHASRCTQGCCAGGCGASSGRSSPAPSLQRAPTLWALLFSVFNPLV